MGVFLIKKILDVFFQETVQRLNVSLLHQKEFVKSVYGTILGKIRLKSHLKKRPKLYTSSHILQVTIGFIYVVSISVYIYIIICINLYIYIHDIDIYIK